MRILFAALFSLLLMVASAHADVKITHEKDVENPKALAPFKACDWKVSGAPGKESIAKISQKEAGELVAQFFASTDDKVVLAEYEIKDINKDGVYDIVATIQDVCAACPNTLVVLTNSGNDLRLFTFWPTLYAHLQSDVRDLNKDGTLEIIARTPLNSKTTGNANFIPWLDIYTWKNGAYVKDNKAFADFYRTSYLPQQQSEIKRLQSIIKDIHAGTSLRAFKNEKLKKKQLDALNGGIAHHQAAIDRVNKEILGK